MSQALFQDPQMSKGEVRSDSESFLQKESGKGWSAKWQLVFGSPHFCVPDPLSGRSYFLPGPPDAWQPKKRWSGDKALPQRWTGLELFTSLRLTSFHHQITVSGWCRERERRSFPLSLQKLPTQLPYLALSLESTVQKYVNYTYRAHLPVSASAGTEWKSAEKKVPRWVRVGTGDHSLDRQLCRDFPAATSELEENTFWSWEQTENSENSCENPGFLSILV
jgi:hypothetical protein